MECFVFHSSPDRPRKVWCIEKSSNAYTTYWGAFGQKMRSTQKTTSGTSLNEVGKKMREKINKGYVRVEGYLDENDHFHLVPSSVREQIVAIDPVELDLTKIFNKEKSFYF